MQTSFNDIYSQLTYAIVERDLSGKKRFDDKCIAEATHSDYTGPKSRFLPLDVRDLINKQLEGLEQRGILRLKPKPSASTLIYTADIIQGAPLNDLYGEAGMMSVQDVQRYVAGSLSAALDAGDIQNSSLREFAEECIIRASIGGKGSLFMAGDRLLCMKENRAAIDAFKGADAVLQMASPELVRHISIKAYGNSKAFNDPTLYRKINIILSATASDDVRTRYIQERDAGGNPSWCSAFGVMKNPYSEVFEGNFDVYAEGEALSVRGIPFSFWSDHAKSYERILLKADTILTIENETTYTDFHADGVVKCFTGGFPSHFLVELLRNIAVNNPSVRWLHWSDIDPSGFEIFSFLRQQVTGKYEPYNMDAITYRKHSGMALPVSEWSEHDSILNMKYFADPVFSEIAYILDNTHKKLEQEAISLCLEGFRGKV